jgi:hypothetical protein
MDVKDYCKGLEQELTIWKARLFDLHRKIDRLIPVQAVSGTTGRSMASAFGPGPNQ